MKKKILIILTVIVLLALGSGWIITYDKLETSRHELETQIVKTTKYEQLSENYSKSLQAEKVLTKELQTNTERLNTQMTELRDETEKQKKEFEDQITVIEKEVATLENDITLYKDTFGEVYSNISSPSYVYEGIMSTRPMSLTNKQESVNPTWEELKKFLREDTTDQHQYIVGLYVCSNFAETLHNNAEEAGIRTALVIIEFKEGPGHALNAFKTTDRDLVFVDCTGLEPFESGPRNRDKICTVEMNKKPAIKSIFPDSGWESNWKVPSDWIVTSIKVYW